MRELGTFYLTDFLLTHFDRLVIRGLGIDRHPAAAADATSATTTSWSTWHRSAASGRLVEARAAADRLGLAFDYQRHGLR